MSRAMKDKIYGELERVGKALASRRRLELLDLLSQSPKTVEDLSEETGMSVANTSQHLQTLKGANLVVGTREGSHVRYELAGRDVAEFFVAFRELGEKALPGIEVVVREEIEREEEPVEALVERVRKGAVTVIDARPEAEYRAAHLSGALRVAPDEADEGLESIPSDRPVVAYCRGPYCTFADEAVRRLRSRGYDAHRLDMSVVEMEQLGLPVEREKR